MHAPRALWVCCVPFTRSHLQAYEIVDPRAVRVAEHVVTQMLSSSPSCVVARLAGAGVRVAIIGRTQHTTDIPEHAFLKWSEGTPLMCVCGGGGAVWHSTLPHARAADAGLASQTALHDDGVCSAWPQKRMLGAAPRTDAPCRIWSRRLSSLAPAGMRPLAPAGGRETDSTTRGLGGSVEEPTTSCGEENLLMEDDRWGHATCTDVVWVGADKGALAPARAMQTIATQDSGTFQLLHT
jgi:hypothetical protein